MVVLQNISFSLSGIKGTLYPWCYVGIQVTVLKFSAFYLIFRLSPVLIDYLFAGRIDISASIYLGGHSNSRHILSHQTVHYQTYVKSISARVFVSFGDQPITFGMLATVKNNRPGLT